MKKNIVLILAFVFLLSGCGQASAEQSSSPAPIVENISSSQSNPAVDEKSDTDELVSSSTSAVDESFSESTPAADDESVSSSTSVADKPVSASTAAAEEPGPASSSVKAAPLTIDSCHIMYEDTEHKWPFIQYSVTNQQQKTISGYQIAWLAFDHDGKPMELYWDARNVDKSGDHGNVGFGNGVDYGIVVGIQEYSPKSYEWVLDTEQSILPSKTATEGGWHLFDGWWDQPSGDHKVKYILSCIKQVTYQDGSVWDNPDYSEWADAYKGKSNTVEFLQAYYPHV